MFEDDFRRALEEGVDVEVHLNSGDKLTVEVDEINELEGFVSVYTPAHYGDRETTRKIRLDQIQSVTVTDIKS